MGTYDAEVQDAIEFAAREMAEEEHDHENEQHGSDRDDEKAESTSDG